MQLVFHFKSKSRFNDSYDLVLGLHRPHLGASSSTQLSSYQACAWSSSWTSLIPSTCCSCRLPSWAALLWPASARAVDTYQVVGCIIGSRRSCCLLGRSRRLAEAGLADCWRWGNPKRSRRLSCSYHLRMHAGYCRQHAGSDSSRRHLLHLQVDFE